MNNARFVSGPSSQEGIRVRVDAIKNSFPAVVQALGHDPEEMLAAHGLNLELLTDPNGSLQYRTMIELLETTAARLECPDFGLRLARCDAEGLTVLGPLEVAMRHSQTLRQALEYCSRNKHVYTEAIHVSVERDDKMSRDYMLWDLLIDGIACQRQVVEHALALTCNTIRSLSDGLVQPTGIWFTHNRKAPAEAYLTYFPGVPVRFGMPFNAVYFDDGDLDRPIANRNPQLYRMAVSYIDLQFPLSAVLLTSRVRVVLAQLLAVNRCTQVVVAEMLGMHPRTFQRRLKEEGTTFEAIVDLVRREIALRNLADSSVPLVQIAEKLGYSETSVLTRSCHRWFSRSPRELRREMGQALQGEQGRP